MSSLAEALVAAQRRSLATLDLYVVGVCYRCNFDLTGEDPDGDARERALEESTESERTEI